jgi:tRNA threonylcarbamoyladenosine biosynthesis protein TsaB
MSVLVAIETATDVGSVAVGRDGLLAGEVVIGVRSRHAESLLPALDFLLATVRVGRDEIGAIVVGGGPGSFTGVRVAAATARGLAMGLRCRCSRTPALPLWRRLPLRRVKPVCAMFDARRGEVYAACYRAGLGGELETLLAPCVGAAGTRSPRRCGRSQPGSPARAQRGMPNSWAFRAAQAVEPRASMLLRLAAADAAGNGRVQDTAGWEPDYLRASGAERGIAG